MSSHKKYGAVTLLERIFLYRHLVLLPLKILTALFLRTALPSFSTFANTTWKRTVYVILTRYGFQNIAPNEIQYLLGTSLQTYTKFIKQNNLPEVIDELGNDTRLLWIGEKHIDRVILYVHGGGYMIGVPDHAIAFFLHYKRKLLKESGQDVGIAILSYTPLPEGVFPKNLAQLQLGLAHLFEKEHILPENTQLLGDSAGGHLIYQYVSQALHPHPSLPSYNLPSKLGGICLMSPGIDMLGHSWDLSDEKIQDRFKGDPLVLNIIPVWGHMSFGRVPSDQAVHIDPMVAPEGWLDDIGKISSRWLITAGSEEALVIPICEWYEKQLEPVAERKEGVNVQLYVQRGGNHDDGLVDFMLDDDPEDNDVSQLIWTWFTVGLARSG